MRTRLTIEYLDPLPDGTEVPSSVLDFDELHIQQNRQVDSVFEGGQMVLKPSPVTTTIITGSLTSMRADQKPARDDGSKVALAEARQKAEDMIAEDEARG